VTYKRVTVHWLDSSTHIGWEDAKRYKDVKPCRCESTGYLVINSKSLMAISLSLSGDDINGTITIPRKCVSYVEELDVKPAMPSLSE